MKKIEKKRIKHNAKLTKISCFRCNILFSAHRNNAKYCSSLCRVQENNIRKEIGFVNYVFSGTFNELKVHLCNSDYTKLNYGFDDDFEDIKEIIEIKKLHLPWKYCFKDYMIYHTPHIKKKPFELYFNDSKLLKYNKSKQPFPVFIAPKILKFK